MVKFAQTQNSQLQIIDAVGYILPWRIAAQK